MVNATSPAAPDEADRLTPERLAAENARHDRILAGLTLLLAFLLASFPVNNPDVYLRLRTGEMLLHGTLPPGADPFSFGTDDQTWINTSWLADVLFYLVYANLGGAGLVLLRGLLVVTLVLVWFRSCRRSGSRLAAVLCLGLAAVVISYRLLLRSELFSFLGLALTFYLLDHPPVERPAAGPVGKVLGWTRGRPWVFLPPLFALWANLDGWFILGPAAVALYLVGDALQAAAGGGALRKGPVGYLNAAERRTLAVTGAVALAACLLNPYHVRAFQIPAEASSEALLLLQGNAVIQQQAGPQTLGASPFEAAYFRRAGAALSRPSGLSIAEWCFYPFALLGAVSLLLPGVRGRWPRALVWLGAFALAAWEGRNVGLFAAVAAPVTALNWQDWVAARFGERPAVRRLAVAGGQLLRIAMLLFLVALIGLMFVPTEEASAAQRALASPGGPAARAGGNWSVLEAASGLVHSRGALGWSLRTDPSCRGVTKQLEQWRREGRLPGRTFFYDWLTLPSYAAWFDPGCQTLMDQRFQVRGRSVRAFLDAYQWLRQPIRRPEDGRPNPDALADRWQDVFRKYDISHLVLNVNQRVSRPHPRDKTQSIPWRLVDLLLADRTLPRSDGDPGQPVWQLLRYVDGRTAVLAWTGSPLWAGGLNQLRFDPVAEAFRKPELVDPEAEAADDAGQVADWLTGQQRRPPLAVEAARWHLDQSAAAYQQMIRERRKTVLLTAPFLALIPPGPPWAALGTFNYEQVENLSNPVPEAELLLAVRAARRAIAARPDFAEAYDLLFQAYQLLQEQQLEALLAAGRGGVLRQAQSLAALRGAVNRRPPTEEPLRVLELAKAYQRRGYLDLAVKYYRLALEGVAVFDLPPGVERVRFTEEVTRNFQEQMGGVTLEQLEKQLTLNKANFDQRANSVQSDFEAALVARQLALIDEMSQFLRKIVDDPITNRREYQNAYKQLTNLYLNVGEPERARPLLLNPLAPDIFGPQDYNQQLLLWAAQVGEYGLVQRQQEEFDAMQRQFAAERGLLAMQLATLDTPGDFPAVQGSSRLREALQRTRDRVPAWCQAGLLALEAGQTQTAAGCFQKAVELDRESPFLPLARRYLRLIKGQQRGTAAD